MEASQETCFGAKTRTVGGSDYSPTVALSEDKDIFSNWGPSRGFGDLGRRANYFQGAGEHC